MLDWLLRLGQDGLGSWFANQKPSSLFDVKTTQEGFLEVSKILGKVFVGF